MLANIGTAFDQSAAVFGWLMMNARSTLRRSQRCTNAIHLDINKYGGVFMTRMKELFFDEDSDPPPLRVVRYGRHQLTLEHASPNIYIIDQFLTESELQYLDENVCQETSKFKRSFLDGPENAHSLDTDHRSSFSASLDGHEETKTIRDIKRKAAGLFGLTEAEIEPLQVVRYMPGESFGVHHDMGTYDPESGTVVLPPRNRLVPRRLVTIFCYLNNLDDNGGSTRFPHCTTPVMSLHNVPFSMNPRRGMALVFSNVNGQEMPDERTIHEGEEVTGGVPKFGLNIWVRERF